MPPAGPSRFPIVLAPDPASAPCEFENSRTLMRLWLDQVARDGEMPGSDRLDLAAMKSLLPELVVYDVFDERTVVFRLAGTVASARIGFEPKGRNLVELMPKPIRQTIGRGFVACATSRIGLLAHYRHLFSGGKPGRIEMLMLPLATPPGIAPRVMTLVSRQSYTLLPALGIETAADTIDDVTFIDVGFGIPELAPLGFAA